MRKYDADKIRGSGSKPTKEEMKEERCVKCAYRTEVKGQRIVPAADH
jgi:hypothetical protein